ncbi:acyl-lipid (8-3)-desaturase-like isoform X3 [Bradysia coprophila]|uniref:acyl-lipid (8-3)-desaturase-like isoform X3 n=1 Tax=Bradysia coprophila TaxID=38358 RepID=UPI00187D8164|nr:acyl-lipid (8-3)-desaturase-like isoform X3 [Bradysia coprophila]
MDFSDLLETPKMETKKIDRIANGSGTKEILCDGYFYDVTNFISRHPGGSIIMYYTQRSEDATHAIQQFHQRSTERVRMMMKAFKRRPASDSELGLEEAVIKKNRALTEDFNKLYLELEQEGLFEPSYTHNILRLVELLVMTAAGVALIQCQSYLAKFIGSVFIGIVRGRSGWMQHESGHMSLSGNPRMDRIFHALLLGLGLGMSSSWWASQHNRHHAMPQRLHHDVDLNTMPLIAYSAKVVKKPKDGKRFWIKFQAYLFLIDTLLVGLSWCYYIHPKYVFKHKHYLQLVAMVAHHWLIYKLGFWPVLLSSWVAATYLLLNFTLNHTHLPVTTQPSHWVEYSLLHTADVEQTPWCDWWMGYLNYQIEHHLFPTMPQFRHPRITGRVKALAEKHNLPYYVYSYREAVGKTFRNMSDVSKELSKM